MEIQSATAPFLLRFIALDGRKVTIERAIYGGQKREPLPVKGNRNVSHRVPLLKDTNKIPITNLDAPEGDAFRTPFVSLIIQFNQYRVMH